MIKLTSSTITLSVIGLLSLITPATAQTITGSGSVSGNLTLNATGVFFNSGGVTTPANPLMPGSSNTGSFAGLSTGAIHNLPGTLAPGPLVIKSFASFNTSAGTIIFDLQSIAPGFGSSDACSAAITGSVCTPTGSPFSIIQTAPNAVSVSLTLHGLAYVASAGSGSATTTVSFSMQTTMIGTIPSILPVIASAAGLQNSFSATIAPSS